MLSAGVPALWPRLDSWKISIRVSYYKVEPYHASATYPVFVNYMPHSGKYVEVDLVDMLR